MSRIFLSYRRKDSPWAVGRLYDRLAQEFDPKNLFLDVRDIDLGEDFIAKVRTVVSACDVLLVMIGPGWSDARDATGRRRLEDPNDLVRIEVATALTRGIRVIPILIDEAPIPREDELPEELRPLVRRNAKELEFKSFHADADSLLRVLARVLEEPRVDVEPRATSDPSRDEGLPIHLPASIRIETLGGVATPLIRGGVILPARATDTFSTAKDDQDRVEIRLVYGESERVEENVDLGRFILDGIPRAPRGVPQIRLQVDVDSSLVMTVQATDEGTGRREVLDAVDLRQVDLPEGVAETAPPQASAFASEIPGLFEQFFGAKEPEPPHPDGPSPPRTLRIDLKVTLQEALRGVDRTIELRSPIQKTVQVHVPPGVETGALLRLPGGGETGRDGRAGDLLVRVTVAPEDGIRREGADLHVDHRVSPEDLSHGGEAEISILGQTIRFRYPARTKSSAKLRLRGMGMPLYDQPTTRGDLYVHLRE